MKPYRRDHFISSLRQVERRITSECPSKGIPNKGKLNLGNANEGFGRNPDKNFSRNFDVSPAKRQKMITNSEEKPVPTPPKFENDSKEIQSSMASPNTQFSFGSPILGYRAQVFMDASSSSGESEAAAEFLSHPSNQMWMNSSEEPETETWDECLDIGDSKYYTERESGGFDDIVDLCKLLKLDGDCLQAPQKSHQSLEMDEPSRVHMEYQISTFYSKVAQVKGPKSEEEVKALDAWIHHFVDRKKEPFRLAHLLLTKAASQHILEMRAFDLG
ncbi:hypothetical protein SUGI_0635540 [Cryptomeria japonica]|uniref:uncharacterized protein LOC131051081 isoform X2 n=1 Tax=Cryptomeria japonica TaxID=3369 RepID=UPI0024148345|nr:uncharacterized protein LOC131051081 isoform X2 [Cryptomeria japonica]GLJ31636.1 hypothetical protein SUGI_0635540 [Cryptomeria japonica]